MKKFIKFIFVTAFMFGGWVLAAASLHVVRTPNMLLFGKVPLPTVEFIPKAAISFENTYIDTTKWTVVDVEARPGVRARLEQAGKAHLLKEALDRPAPVAPVIVPETKAPTLTSIPAEPQATPAIKPEAKPVAKVETRTVKTEVVPEVKPAPKSKSIFSEDR